MMTSFSFWAQQNTKKSLKAMLKCIYFFLKKKNANKLKIIILRFKCSRHVLAGEPVGSDTCISKMAAVT